MGISSIFRKSFDILKANPKIILPYFILTALIGVLSIYMSLHLASAASGAGVNTMASFSRLAITVIGSLAPLLVLIIILAVLVAPLLMGMYINIADQGHQKRAVSLGKAFGVAKKNYLNMLFLSILVTIIWIGIFAVLGVVFAVPAFLSAGIGRAAWFIAGAIVSIVVLVVLSLYLFEAYAALILEKLGPFGALSRSFQIGRKKLKLLFRVFILAVIVVAVFVLLDVAIVYSIEALLGLSGHRLLGLGIGQLANFLISSSLNSWFMMIPVAFYKEYVGSPKATQRRKK